MKKRVIEHLWEVPLKEQCSLYTVCKFWLIRLALSSSDGSRPERGEGGEGPGGDGEQAAHQQGRQLEDLPTGRVQGLEDCPNMQVCALLE